MILKQIIQISNYPTLPPNKIISLLQNLPVTFVKSARDIFQKSQKVRVTNRDIAREKFQKVKKVPVTLAKCARDKFRKFCP